MRFKRVCSKILLILFINVIFFSFNTTEVKCANFSDGDFKSSVIPLKTVEAENGFEDLAPLLNILKDKKIVSIGEGTHGTKEFFQMKHRMLEFLVEKMGYTLFAMEAGFGDAQVVNDYILYGKGNSKDAVKALKYWTWTTEEVENMVQWMRKYNENPEHKRKIKFYGFDMQGAQVEEERILDYLKSVDNESVKKFQQVFSELNDKKIYSFNEDKITNIKNNIQELINVFEKNKQQYILKSSSSEYEIIHEDLNIISQFMEKVSKKDDMAKLSKTRDYYMAENIKWILNYEKQFGNDKIMLWAHNGHVSKAFPTYTPMGNYLKETFKDDMYVIGQEFYKGNFRAFPYIVNGFTGEIGSKLKEFNIKNSAFYTFAYGLQSIEVPIYFMDFKYASQDKRLEQWLSTSKLIHEIGAVYTEGDQGVAPQVPIDAFDGVIFISNTSASVRIK